MAALAISLIAASARAQDADKSATTDSRVSGEVGAVIPITWAKGDGAPTVLSTLSPLLALRAGWRANDIARVGVMLSTSTGSVSLKENGEKWKSGSLTLSDVVGTLVLRTSEGRWSGIGVEVGAGMSFIAAPKQVAPFQDGASAKPVGQAALAIDVPQHLTSRPISLVLRGTWMRMGGETVSSAVSNPGTITRATVSVRIGR